MALWIMAEDYVVNWVETPVSEMQPEWKSCFRIMDLGHLSN
jgi:hypothetical protein